MLTIKDVRVDESFAEKVGLAIMAFDNFLNLEESIGDGTWQYDRSLRNSFMTNLFLFQNEHMSHEDLQTVGVESIQSYIEEFSKGPVDERTA